MIRLLDFVGAELRRRPFPLAVLMVAATAWAGPAGAGAPEHDAGWYDGRWPHERSELPPHAGATFGRLDNGFRYVILPNGKPEGRVHLSLDVQAGSLMERDDEQGLAHYLEHMAFNGSRHFPPGALIPFLQKHGMSFGGDVNAHTSFAETVYKLDLSSAARDDVGQGLRVLRDVADGMLLLPAEVDKERGVILAEKAARDTEKSRVSRSRREVLFAGTKFVQEPIGIEPVLLTADSERVRRFYETWYRPERMVLVIVGDLDPDLIRGDVAAMFADLKPRDAAAPVPWWGDARHQGVHAYQEKTSASGLSMTVTAIHPRKQEADSETAQRRRLLDALAGEMFQGRLLARTSGGNAPFVAARYNFSATFGLFPTANLAASCSDDLWRDCLAGLEQELRRALDFGFTAEEFEESRRFYRARIEAMVTEAPNRRSKNVAEEIISAINSDQVFQSEEQARAMLIRLLDTMTRDEAERAFRAAWQTDNRLIFTAGSVDLGPDGAAALVNAWQTSGTVALSRHADAEASAFPYLAEPQQSVAIIEDSTRALPGAELTQRTIRLANGVTLHMLPTPFETGRLSLSFLFGAGLNPLSDSDHAIALTTASVLREGGSGRLSREDQRRLFAWKKLKVDEGYGADSFTITASGATEDQDLLLTTLWTQYRDPNVAEDSRQRMLAGLRLGRNDRLNTVEGAAPLAMDNFLFGGAKRSGELTDETAATVTLAQMRDFLVRSRATGPRTLIAVGDFDPEALAARVARLFASEAAPARSATAAAPRRPSFPAGQSVNLTVADKLDKASLVVAWRSDLTDEQEQRTLAIRRLLAAAVNDRLREQVREELGASYSPSGRYRHDTDLGGFGMFTMAVKMERASLDKVRAAARDAAQSLAADGIKPGTAERLRAPMLAGWENSRRQNRQWLRLLELETLRGLPYAQWNAELPDDLRRVSDDDLTREAKAVFTQEAAEIAVIAATATEATP